uniref:Putative defensin n=1 Tax=Rhipicephalus microplus TaxID=6941 RepID=A0A6G5A8F7_RHIMP
MRTFSGIALLPCLIATLELAYGKPMLNALLHHLNGDVTGHHDDIIHQLGNENPYLTGVHNGVVAISAHDHTEHHQGVHYEAGAYGCPLLGVICKHHCVSIGHGSGYCGGPHLGRCICPIW